MTAAAEVVASTRCSAMTAMRARQASTAGSACEDEFCLYVCIQLFLPVALRELYTYEAIGKRLDRT
jgi:hypothetical protein